MNWKIKTKNINLILSVGLIFVLAMVGCGREVGEAAYTVEVGEGVKQSGTSSGILQDSSKNHSGSATKGSVSVRDAADESGFSGSAMVESNPTESAPSKEVAENVITIGIIQNAHGWRDIKEDADNFNGAQSKYRVEVVEYGYTSLLMDIMRGQGADIFSLWDMPIEMLTRKGVLEDLTPYFSTGDAVNYENLTGAVKRAGTIDEKFTCLIPDFYFHALVVEKGYVQDGGWSVEDYLALGEKYPSGMLNKHIQNPLTLFYNELALVPESYVDWEEGTCSFDSESFVALLEKMKGYSEKQYEISPAGTIAERIHKQEYLTQLVSVIMDSHMSNYLNLKAVLGNEFEIVGFPGTMGGLDGDGTSYEAHYRMLYDKMYGMNAASEKKEGAWAFLEYLLSEEVQREAAEGRFPARADVLESVLQEMVDFRLPEHYKYSTYDSYTEEYIKEFRPFTKEDKEAVLEMLNHVQRFSVMNTGDVYDVLVDELNYFFNGAKSARETAALIQNRIQLYLDENK